MKAVPAFQDTKIAAFIVHEEANRRKIHRMIYKQSNREIGFDLLDRIAEEDIARMVRWTCDEYPTNGTMNFDDLGTVLAGMMSYYACCLGTKKAKRLFRSLHFSGDNSFYVFKEEFMLWWEQYAPEGTKQNVQQMLDFEHYF